MLYSRIDWGDLGYLSLDAAEQALKGYPLQEAVQNKKNSNLSNQKENKKRCDFQASCFRY